jgi:hypothetical protein
MPAVPPNAMAVTCPSDDGTASAVTQATTATVARGRSGARERAIPHTAWATTATATSFSPRSQPAWETSPIAPIP